MWETIKFKTHQEMENWKYENTSKYQMRELFTTDYWCIEYMPKRIIINFD